MEIEPGKCQTPKQQPEHPKTWNIKWLKTGCYGQKHLWNFKCYSFYYNVHPYMYMHGAYIGKNAGLLCVTCICAPFSLLGIKATPNPNYWSCFISYAKGLCFGIKGSNCAENTWGEGHDTYKCNKHTQILHQYTTVYLNVKYYKYVFLNSLCNFLLFFENRTPDSQRKPDIWN